MTQLTSVFEMARQRAQTGQFLYAGAVTPDEAYVLLQGDSYVQLIDVRTRAERDWVGRVFIPANQEHSVEWNVYPENISNPDFLIQLDKVADKVAQKDTALLFLCRSGVRSRLAAQRATEAGYRNCFDILTGFEGDKDAEGHRKTLGGWCQNGLPWIGA